MDKKPEQFALLDRLKDVAEKVFPVAHFPDRKINITDNLPSWSTMHILLKELPIHANPSEHSFRIGCKIEDGGITKISLGGFSMSDEQYDSLIDKIVLPTNAVHRAGTGSYVAGSILNEVLEINMSRHPIELSCAPMNPNTDLADETIEQIVSAMHDTIAPRAGQ